MLGWAPSQKIANIVTSDNVRNNMYETAARKTKKIGDN